MIEVDIYYNKYGELTIAHYDENQILAGRCNGEKLKRILAGLAEQDIENVYIDKNNTCVVTYDEGRVNIRNISNKKNNPDMQDYLKVIDAKMTRQKQERAAKVTRTNKQRGALTFTTVALAAALAFTILVSAKDNVSATVPNDDEIAITSTATYLQSITDVFETTTKPIITETVPLETAPPQIEEVPIVEYVYIDYTDRSSSQKLETARELYGNMINKYAHTYGLDPELVLALATQERGVHSSEKDPGGATGLMQIQNSVWVGSDLTAYNFSTESYEKIKVTKEKIQDCETNIKIGCMILQNMIKAKDYNIVAGLLSYNMGGYSVDKILNQYQKENEITRQEVLSNQNDCGWLAYRDIIKIGDRDYVQHVLSYMGNDINTYVIKPNGERVEVSIKNYEATKTISR